MRLSQYLLPTLREAPSDADNISAKLMARAGLTRKVASGIYSWLPLGLRVMKKVERIVREEMDAIGGQEVSLPVIQPRALWNQTGRWQVYGKELLRIADRKNTDFCFAPTAEEVITDLARREIHSWRQLPMMFYQIGLKFRDEIRPRFGVMRAREFLMKDAYSFHVDEADCESYYRRVYGAYEKIFTRCGLRFKAVEAQSGAIGGSFSHEFMVLAETGEETVVSCKACSYGANLERAELTPPSAPESPPEEMRPIEEFATPGAKSVEEVSRLAGEPRSRFIKTQFYMSGKKPVVALLRGDFELNESKLAAVVGDPALHRCNDEQYSKAAGCPVGFAGPQGLENAEVIADFSLKGLVNGITGANKADTHARNVNFERDFKVTGFKDLRMATPADPCPRCGGEVEFMRGIEVGHTFKLGTKYAAALKATYLDKKQKAQTLVMGCYGIGVSRVVAAAIEQGHDKDGIIWPPSIAPFQVYLVLIDGGEDSEVSQAGGELLRHLEASGLEVLVDDRDAKPGVKFKDADLIGIPYRLVVSPKTLKDSQVEFKRRGAAEAIRWPLGEAAQRLTEIARK